MNHTEAIKLCRYAKAACPQQAFDQYTPDAWADLLADIGFDDASAALRQIVMRQPFVAPSEIRIEVARIRRRRLDTHDPVDPPSSLDPDDTAAYQKWLRATRRAIGDGVQVESDRTEISLPTDLITKLRADLAAIAQSKGLPE